jgi:predicted transporter
MMLRTISKRIRVLFAILMLISVLSSFAATVCAQDPWDDPSSGGEQIDRKTGQLKAKSTPSLADQIQLMTRRFSGLMQFLQSEVVAHFSEWALYMAQLLSGLAILYALARRWYENSGRATANFLWFFPRCAVCLGLIVSCVWLIGYMDEIGKEIAHNPSRNSVLGVPFRFYDYMQTNFSESYAKIAMNTFTVKVPGEKDPFTVKPIDGTGGFFGVLRDQESTVRDFNNKLNDSTYMLPRLFWWLGVCRGILEAGDFWLMILGAVLLIAFKIFAPFAAVLAIDRDLARRFAYPFVFGVIVLTLVWPTVSCLIRGAAYMFGNIALAMGDSAPVYTWNEATWQAFRSVQSQPVYTALFACFTMTVSAICLWLSPVIAYKVSMGQIYEGVSNAASTAAGMVVGTVTEWYGSNVAAKYSKEAAQVQATGVYDSDTARAASELRAMNRSAEARQELSAGQVRGVAIQQIGQAYAMAGGQWRMSNVQERFSNSSAENHVLLSRLLLGYGAVKEMKDVGISATQQNEGIFAQGISDLANIEGALLSRAGMQAGPLAGGSVTGAAVGAAGAAAGNVLQLGGATIKNKILTDALLTATKERFDNIGATNRNNQEAQKLYLGATRATNKEYAYETGKAAYDTAEDAKRSINSGAAVQIGAINRGTEMEKEANKIRYDAQVEAAGITRTASIKVADLHITEAIARNLFSKIARDIEGSMVLRY